MISHVHVHVHDALRCIADTHLKLPIYGEASSSIALECMSKRVPSLNSVGNCDLSNLKDPWAVKSGVCPWYILVLYYYCFGSSTPSPHGRTEAETPIDSVENGKNLAVSLRLFKSESI